MTQGEFLGDDCFMLNLSGKKIWAFRLGFGLSCWDLGFKAGVFASKLEFRAKFKTSIGPLGWDTLFVIAIIKIVAISFWSPEENSYVFDNDLLVYC